MVVKLLNATAAEIAVEGTAWLDHTTVEAEVF
jgi:hypothetical protein